jgi:S-formylglutathione hydrolase FrmB
VRLLVIGGGAALCVVSGLLGGCASPARDAPAAKTAKASVGARTSAAAPAPVRTADRITGPGTVRTIELPVTDLGRGGKRAARIYTPTVSGTAELPVLYLLHGLPGGAGDLCSADSARQLDGAFRRGAAPFMVVCPDGTTSDVDDNEWADSSNGSAKLETFVTGELREAVEGDHPRLAAMRAIGGFSMGGFGAASIALRHPGLYGQVVTLAGYFHLDDPEQVFGTTAAQQNAHNPSKLVSSSAGHRWYLAEAAGDTSALTAHDSERFASLLRRNGATVTLRITRGSHGVQWAVQQLGGVAAFLSAGWGSP